MKTIIVATDFSPSASNAAKYAADIAVAIKADLVLFHAYQIPVIYSEVPLAFSEEKMMQEAKDELLNLKNELLQKTGDNLNIETEIRSGKFFSQLKALCKSIKPYTVITGSQGTTAAERLVFGGHTLYAMKHLTWPLITVPVNVTFSSIKKIGLACDLNKVNDTVPFEEIKILVNDLKAELHILNIDKHYGFNPETDYEGVLLEEMIASLKPAFHFLNNINTDEGIIDFVEKNQIDLLIMLPKRYDLLRRLIHKSHTRRLILHSHVPVMAIHTTNV